MFTRYTDNPKLILTRGLPGSGKSTFAKTLVAKDPKHYVRVSRDDLRQQMFNAGHGVDERAITAAEDAMVRGLLQRYRGTKMNIIIDAMHLYQRDINRWQKLGHEVKVMEFHVPLEELLERNAQREWKVPENVIKDKWKQATTKKGELIKVSTDPYQFASKLYKSHDDLVKARHTYRQKPCYIFDIDGTLAWNTGDRGWHDYDRVYLDELHGYVANVCKAIQHFGYEVVILSGRKGSQRCREVTEEWLKKHDIRYDALFMREEKDNRSDTVVKYELLKKHVIEDYDVMGVFDDRPTVCEMWRNIGIPTFQVGNPDNRF